MVRHGQFKVWASDTTFGDPCQFQVKRLRVTGRFDGLPMTVKVAQDGTLNLLDVGQKYKPTIYGLEDAHAVNLDAQTVAFTGWTLTPSGISADFEGKRYRTRPQIVPKGSDSARLWAQQMIASGAVSGTDAVREASFKYGIPTNVTAMFAGEPTPGKTANEPEWAPNDTGSWRLIGQDGSGLRVEVPNARQVQAILPGGQTVYMIPNGDVWRGSFSVPAAAPSGLWSVRIRATLKDGRTLERECRFHVGTFESLPLPG